MISKQALEPKIILKKKIDQNFQAQNADRKISTIEDLFDANELLEAQQEINRAFKESPRQQESANIILNGNLPTRFVPVKFAITT